jgi:putative addiction module component (TIGR02574 family)
MISSSEQLLTAALALPVDERLELVEALIVSFQSSDQPPFDDSWREVISRRSAELESGLVESVTWEEVRRRARETIGG